MLLAKNPEGVRGILMLNDTLRFPVLQRLRNAFRAECGAAASMMCSVLLVRALSPRYQGTLAIGVDCAQL